MTTGATGRLFRITAMTGVGLAVAGALARATEGSGADGARLVAIVIAIFAVMWAVHALVRSVASAALGVLAIAVMALFSPVMANAVAAVVCATALWRVFQRAQHRSPSDAQAQNSAMTWMCDAAAALVGAIAVASAHQYADFLILERLPVEVLNRDTMFHASIAAMIKNYGAVSTGLDGLLTTPYHAGSHAFFGALSAMSGLPVLQCYGTLHLAVICPLLLFAMAHYSAAVLHGVGKGLGIWLVVACAVTAWNTMPLFADVAVFDSFFVGESYTFSLALLLIAFSQLTTTSRGMRDHAVAAALIVVAAASKGSVGVIGVAMLGATAVIDTWRHRVWRRMVLSAVTGVVVLVLMRAVAQLGLTMMKWGPFTFFVANSAWPNEMRAVSSALAGVDGPAVSLRAIALLFFCLAMHFLPSTLQAVAMTRTAGRAVFDPLVMAAWGLVAAGAGLAAVGSLNIIAGGVFYFSSVAMFVSFPFVVLVLRRVTVLDAHRWSAAAMVVVSLVLTTAATARWKPENIARKFGHARVIGDGRAVLAEKAGNDVSRTLGPTIAQLAGMRRARGVHDATTLGSAVSAPREDMYGCVYTPFVLPAVSEQPWTNLLHPSTCSYPETYLFYWYLHR